MKNKKVYFLIFFIIFLLCFIIYKGKKDVVYQIKPKFFQDSVYTINGAANMFDNLVSSYNENILISPLNINTSLNILYGMTDNNSYKEIKNYFGKNEEENKELIANINKNNLFIMKEKTNFNVYYENLRETFYNKGYDKINIQDIKNMNDNEKKSFMTLLVRLNLTEQRINGLNNYSEKYLKNVSPTKEEMDYTTYEVKNLLDEVMDKDESYWMKSTLNNVNLIYFNKQIYDNKLFDKKIMKNFNDNLIFYDLTKKDSLEKMKNNLEEKVGEKTKFYLDDELINKGFFSLNSLVFESRWDTDINPLYNDNKEFTDIKGQKKVVEMMNFVVDSYLENDYAFGFKKNYQDGKYSFVGILPKQSGIFKISELNVESLFNSENKKYANKVSIPKFNINYEADLVKLFYNMGVKDIFLEQANFNKFTEQKIKMEVMKQKNVFTFAEKGTYSSKNTSQKLEAYSAPDQIKETIFNRPFAYMVINNETKDVLYIGWIMSI